MIVAAGLLLAAGGALPADAGRLPGEENTACESQSPGGDFVQFSCALPRDGSARRFRFQAHFTGGHDDTSASMVLTLDDAPLACDAGSKTRLFGEDGDVSLVCRFSIAGRAGSAAGGRVMLGVALLWSHAQYALTELVAE